MNEISVMIPENFVTDEVNEFRKKLLYLIKNGERKFIINFSQCNFIDSTGLGALISIHKKCIKLNGSFKLLEVNKPSVIKIFELTRLNNVFR